MEGFGVDVVALMLTTFAFSSLSGTLPCSKLAATIPEKNLCTGRPSQWILPWRTGVADAGVCRYEHMAVGFHVVGTSDPLSIVAPSQCSAGERF